MRRSRQTRHAADEAAEFNREHAVGVACLYWPAEREGKGLLSRTRSEAKVFGGHTAVVMIENHTGLVPLSHVEVIR